MKNVLLFVLVFCISTLAYANSTDAPACKNGTTKFRSQSLVVRIVYLIFNEFIKIENAIYIQLVRLKSDFHNANLIESPALLCKRGNVSSTKHRLMF